MAQEQENDAAAEGCSRKLLTSALKLRGTPARILLTEDVGAAFPGPWWKPTKQCANSSNEGMNQGLNARIGELAARYADRGVGIIPLYARFKERGDARKGPITRDNRTDAADCLHLERSQNREANARRRQH